MTFRKASKGVMASDTGPIAYNIGFNNGDETQLTDRKFSELEQLWRGFCEENGFSKSSVDYVERT